MLTDDLLYLLASASRVYVFGCVHMHIICVLAISVFFELAIGQRDPIAILPHVSVRVGRCPGVGSA